MKEDAVYVTHILECIYRIEDYTRTGRKNFFASKLIQDAVIRNLEVIGEASKKVSKELKQRSANIPWREMSGLRDVLIHDYLGVDLNIVWNVVEKELPAIKQNLIKLKENR